MHRQIRDIIDRLLVIAPRGGSPVARKVVLVELSAVENTPLGKLIGRLYYDSKVLEALTFQERTGYPHNGGLHTLAFHCAPLDAIEMLELIKEECLAKLALTDEERQVAHELSYVSQEIHTLRKQM